MNDIALYGLLAGALLTVPGTKKAAQDGDNIDKFAHVGYWILFLLIVYNVYSKRKK